MQFTSTRYFFKVNLNNVDNKFGDIGCRQLDRTKLIIAKLITNNYEVKRHNGR